MKSFASFIAALSVGLLALPAANAQNYPSRAVRIISGVAAGGPGDVASRGAAQALTQALGQPFVIENRVGAEGMLAGEACAKAAPDGYTLCMFDGFQLTLQPAIRVNMPYDSARDLTPVMHLGFGAGAILIHPSVPANSLKELFDLAKAKPDSLAWGSSGVGSPGNLYIAWLKNVKNISFQNVPYKSALQALQATMAGEIQVTSYVANAAAPLVKAGKLKALAVPTSERSPYLPDVPTFKEAGMDIALVVWFALMAPSATPNQIIQRLNAVIAKGLFDNGPMREKYLTTPGTAILPPAGASPEVFAEFMKSQREMFADVAKATGVRIE